jgi:TorA maturation chaperone TorD
MIDDHALLTFRRSYYEVMAALFRGEPSAELVQQLADGIGERILAARNVDPLLGAGWEELARFLRETPEENLAGAVADEYTRLFIGPHGPEINPYESFYLTGHLLDRPLAEVRSFLKIAGIEKLEEYPEPEDFLAFELEVMRWLIEKQAAATDSQQQAHMVRLQLDFLRDHLLVWGPSCAQDIERAAGANFYRFAGKILQAFLMLELSFLREWGLDSVQTLDVVRQRYQNFAAWKGPTFDPDRKPEEPTNKRN